MTRMVHQYLFVFSLFLLIGLNACKDKEGPEAFVGEYAKVGTSGLSNVSPYDAICGGNITNDGGTEITSRGVCWSTHFLPTIQDSFTKEGKGSGRFVSQVKGLNSNVAYYVRAYATNSKGTSYGNEMTLVTADTNHLYPGQVYKGGFVFFVNTNNYKIGLVTAPYDQGKFTWASGDSLCQALVINGYDDWRMPNRDELNLMYESLYLKNIAGFASEMYWSITSFPPQSAWAQVFGQTLNQLGHDKSEVAWVRAVRNF